MTFIENEQLSRRAFVGRTAAVLTCAQSPARLAFAADDEPLRKNALTLRVLCYNIQHGAGSDGKVDLNRQAEVIRAARPDLVALQEVDRNTQRTGGVDQTAVLAKLTGLHGRFGRQIDFEGGQYGQAVLSRVPIDDLKIHVLPGTPERQQRIAVEARLRVASQELSIVSTHLHHFDADFRVQQAARIDELFAGSDRPVILTGDFNASPDAEPVRLLQKNWLLATAETSLVTYPAVDPTKSIDHVLFRPRERFGVVSVEVINEPLASDHRPLLAVLELRP